MHGALRALTTFILGVMAAYLTLFIAALLHLDVRIMGFVAPVVVLLLTFWNGPRTTAHIDGEDSAHVGGENKNRLSTAILIALVIAVSLMILIGGDPFLFTSDSVDHIAYIRTISRTHEAFPEQFYYRDGGTLTHDIRKGMGQVLWGAVNSLTGRGDVAAVWPIMSTISSAFVIVALFCAGLLLFESACIGLISGILFVLFYDGGLLGYNLAMGAAGYLFGRVFYIAALSFMPIAIARKDAGYTLLAVLSGVTAAMTHVAHFAAWMFIAGIFALSSVLGSRGTERTDRFRRAAFIWIVTFVATLPYLVFRYVRDYAPNNALHTHIQGVLYFTDKLYVLNPFVYIQVAGPLGILAAVSLVVLWMKSRRDANLRLLLYGLIAVYVLVFCPLWYPYLLSKMSYLLMRMEFAVPSVLLCAYLIREVWNRMRRRSLEMSALGTVVAVVATVGLLGIPFLKTATGFAYGKRNLREATEASYHNLGDLFAAIEKECPSAAVVASDPITSFGIPAFTDAYAICPLDQHSTPNDSTAIRRIVDCRRIFAPWTSTAETRAILGAYGAEYLVINGRIPPSIQTMYWKPDRKTSRALVERLHLPTSPFRILYERDGASLAKLVVCPTCTETERARLRPPFLGDSLDAETADRFASSRIPGIRIKDVRLSRTEAARGDTLTANITWVAIDHCPFSSYVAFMRFDTGFPKSALYARAYGKPYRKVVESFTQYRYRFRIDFQPLGGIAPPDAWPLLREVHDSVRVVIPRYVAPGPYTVSLRLAEKPQYANYVLGDILTDDDFYNGAVMGKLVVR
jgi:hypothetical protein